MATAVKTAKTLISSQSLAASGSVNGSWDGHLALGGFLTARLTNGGTGPSVAPTVTVNVSDDNSTWRQLTQFTGPTTNSAVTDFTVEIPPPVMYLQVVIAQGASGQPITVESLLHELTSIG